MDPLHVILPISWTHYVHVYTYAYAYFYAYAHSPSDVTITVNIDPLPKEPSHFFVMYPMLVLSLVYIVPLCQPFLTGCDSLFRFIRLNFIFLLDSIFSQFHTKHKIQIPFRSNFRESKTGQGVFKIIQY